MKNEAIIATPTKKTDAITTFGIENEVIPYHINIAPNVVSVTSKENSNRETLNLIRLIIIFSLYLILFLLPTVPLISQNVTLREICPSNLSHTF